MNYTYFKLSQTVLAIILSLFCTSVFATENKAPTVTSIVWGIIEVRHADGSLRTYKDCKLFPTGSSMWDWRKTGTEHVPGIQVADLIEFISHVDVVILSAGMHGVLQVHPDTIKYLKELGKEFHYLQTEQAVELYHQLVKSGKKVGAVLHSTC